MTQVAPVHIGRSSLTVPPLGIGTWQWGDRRVWGYDPGAGAREAEAAFLAATERGITFFDTAEVYGGGVSERLLGRFAASHGRDVVVATKFAPWPWRLRAATLDAALARSLRRLAVDRVDLYQIHWPWSLLRSSSLAARLADAVGAGRVRAVGVSNYSADTMRRMHDLLGARGVPLASNQVRYSLMDRAPERNGVLAACRELDVTLIAYSPLAMGALTGRYSPEHLPDRPLRRYRPFFRKLARAEPLLGALREIGAAHGRTPAQVALAWLASRPGIVPIPGARNATQAASSAEALGLELNETERERLNERSRSI